MRAADALQGAMKLLKDSGCTDIKANKIKFVSSRSLEPSDNAAGDVSKLRCWYDPASECYFVNDVILSASDKGGDEKSLSSNGTRLPNDQVEEGNKAKDEDDIQCREDGTSIKEEDVKEEDVKEEGVKEEDVGDTTGEDKTSEEDSKPKGDDQSSSESKPPDACSKNSGNSSSGKAAFQLAFYIAREHPDVCVLENFTLCHR